MTKKTKILLGIGAVALLIYAYFKNLSITKTSVSAPTDPNNPRTSPMPNNGGVVPPITNQGTPAPKLISDDYTYEVLENFTVEYFNSTNGTNKIASFTKGQIIHAKPIPMGNVGGLATTPDGKYPNMGLVGNAIVNLPQNKLRRV